jgi:ribosomal-protein-alanine N-acetyltransferase
MPSLIIRSALATDVDRLFVIESSAPSAAHWPQSDYKSAIEGAGVRRIVLVAEMGAQTQGFLVARSPFPAEWEIENVVVAEATRRQGLGRSLVTAFLEQIAGDKRPTNDLAVYLEVRESNLAARQLYEKTGFHLDNRRPAYYQSPKEAALIYRYIFQ